MSTVGIPEERRSDHLFLLMGENPVPNWVAARLLLREGGLAHLLHSAGSEPRPARMDAVI